MSNIVKINMDDVYAAVDEFDAYITWKREHCSGESVHIILDRDNGDIWCAWCDQNWNINYHDDAIISLSDYMLANGYVHAYDDDGGDIVPVINVDSVAEWAQSAIDAWVARGAEESSDILEQYACVIGG